MRIKCAYSGLDLQVTHFPGSLHHRECYHPIFTVPQKQLLQHLRKWGNAELTSHDSYLLFLALLNSTDVVEFRTNAIYAGSGTDAIVAQNMESLARAISYTNTIVHPSFSLPGIAITKDTCDLKNSKQWIADWMNCYYQFMAGEQDIKQIQKVKRREELLHQFIKDAQKPISHYAKIIADWAADAGEFPKFPVTIDGKVTSIAEYWKTIIIKCCKAEAIFSILSSDLEELIQHCEDNIEHGSIYAHTLMELLRAGQRRQVNYLGLGDVDLSSSNTTYRIIADDTSIEDAAKLAMIDSAPDTLPQEGNYPSKIAYIRAKLKYQMKQDYLAQLATATVIAANTETITTDTGEEL